MSLKRNNPASYLLRCKRTMEEKHMDWFVTFVCASTLALTVMVLVDYFSEKLGGGEA